MFQSDGVAGRAAATTNVPQGGAARRSPYPMPATVRLLPLASVQRRLWLLDQAGTGGPAQQVVGAIRLNGFINVEALGRGLDDVVQRHKSLRAAFPGLEQRGPLHVVAPSLAVDVEVCDL